MRKTSLWLVLSGLILSSCGTDVNDDNLGQSSVDSSDVKDSLNAVLDSDSAKLRAFVLPTPTQVPTVLRMSEVSFDPSLLDHLSIDQGYAEAEQGARLLGIYLADLGYAALFDEADQSLMVLDKIQALSSELGLANSFDGPMIKRFEANRSNPDSLSYLILEGYEQAHHYFQENDRERLGMLIISGCLVEGLHLACHYRTEPLHPEYYALMTQQKAYLENATLLLSQFGKDDAELAPVVLELETILTQFTQIPDEPVRSYAGGYVIPDNFENSLNSISAQVEPMRNRILNL